MALSAYSGKFSRICSIFSGYSAANRAPPTPANISPTARFPLIARIAPPARVPATTAFFQFSIPASAFRIVNVASGHLFILHRTEVKRMRKYLTGLLLGTIFVVSSTQAQNKPRARDLGAPFD